MPWAWAVDKFLRVSISLGKCICRVAARQESGDGGGLREPLGNTSPGTQGVIQRLPGSQLAGAAGITEQLGIVAALRVALDQGQQGAALGVTGVDIPAVFLKEPMKRSKSSARRAR